jgi:hypothetical protein
MKAPKVPAPPKPAQFQAEKLPDGGTNNAAMDEQAKRRRAMAATAFTGALGLGSPTTSSTVLGG